MLPICSKRELPDIARVLTTEMGKTFASAKGEVAKCASGLRWFAEHAESMLADEVVPTSASDSRAIYRPLGPVLAVMPWNFPLWQVIRFAAPALMLGNTGLLKHSANVPQTALLSRTSSAAPVTPKGSSRPCLIESGRVRRGHRRRQGEGGHPHRIGCRRPFGRRGGRARSQEDRARARRERPVHRPARLPTSHRAAQVGVQARVQNNGQSCIAAKRFIVHADVYDAFDEAFVAGMAGLQVGDPMEPVHRCRPPCERLRSRGDRRAGRRRPRSRRDGPLRRSQASTVPGFFYEPTVLADLTPQMRVYNRRGVRACGDALPRPRRRRGAAACQRFTVRARRQRLDHRRVRAAKSSSSGSRSAWSS